MKRIIIQIYNNLEVLWHSKVKFVSLSQLLECPHFGSNSGVLRVSGFIVGIKKKKKEGRRDIKGEKEGVDQERRKERKKVLNEKNNINKELVKKKKKEQKIKTSLLASNWPSQFCCSFWLQPTQGG